MSLIEKYTKKYGRAFAKQTIQAYMRKQKFNGIEDFMKKNPTMKDFEQNSHLLGIIRTHGYFILNEQEYQEIMEEIRKEEEERKKLQTDNIKTNMVNGHEIVTYTDQNTGEQITVDNTVSNRDIKDQMADVQKEHKQFQQENANNTLNVMNYMQDKIKITPDTVASNEVNMNLANNEEREIAIAAKAFEKEIGHHVDIDLNNKIIYDNGMIYSIEKRGEQYQVISQGHEKVEKQKKGPQLVKKPKPPQAA